MSESEKPIQLGLTSEANPATISSADALPTPESLQFRKAEHAEPGSGPPCVICAKRSVDTYFHANGKVVCSTCAAKVQAGQNAPPPHTLLKSFFYGLGAAIAGTALFSIIWIVTDYQLALIAILIGYMVAKAIRYASKGLGGRPQQILAVLLTYFSITASYIPVLIYHQIHDKKTTEAAASSGQTNQPAKPDASATPAAKDSQPSLVLELLMLIGVALAAPFLALNSGAGAILTLVIIFFGLQRAWRMTGRSNILVVGPYQVGS